MTRNSISRPRLAIASYAKRPDLRPDDRLFSQAVASAGMTPIPVVWDDEGVNWSAFDACVLRSVSDYHLKHAAFIDWVTQVECSIPLWNSADLAIWNSDKTYLKALAERGVPTIQTHWLEQTSNERLDNILSARSWQDAIIKPTVDLGAKNLHKVGRHRRSDQVLLQSLLGRHGVMIQPFFPSVESRGETSLVYIDSRLTHVVRKRPKDGDFRVQASWGGTVTLVDASPDELAVAQQVLDCLDTPPLYARVDLVAGHSGSPCLIELELVEPILFFEENPEAARLLTDAIQVRLKSS